jgi:hypothetical protein
MSFLMSVGLEAADYATKGYECSTFTSRNSRVNTTRRNGDRLGGIIEDHKDLTIYRAKVYRERSSRSGGYAIG